MSGEEKNLVQASESDPEVVPIFVESQVARYSVEVDPDRCCHVFSERDQLAFQFKHLLEAALTKRREESEVYST